ncbi:hypothetical protein L798_10671 [Zootermopsis nevadensis]|uniref:Uncharacterized protein n=1 Tax=Zootermopsis nevadensis TaxID=136037 RepID=A0A067QXL3_ZOONE|nr:hypothetical protein L798_10671 [Zootermopsis nevadensis]
MIGRPEKRLPCCLKLFAFLLHCHNTSWAAEYLVLLMDHMAHEMLESQKGH